MAVSDDKETYYYNSHILLMQKENNFIISTMGFFMIQTFSTRILQSWIIK
jgi:hypothetical protein